MAHAEDRAEQRGGKCPRSALQDISKFQPLLGNPIHLRSKIPPHFIYKILQKAKKNKDENKNPRERRDLSSGSAATAAPPQPRQPPRSPAPCAAPCASAAELGGFQPGRAVGGSCSLAKAGAGSGTGHLRKGITERGEAITLICNYKVKFSPRLQYTNYLPNLKEKWLVLSRETKKGTSWLYTFQRDMFLCTFIP